MRAFNSLAYGSDEELVFGRALHPLVCGHGVEIGGGMVLPEVNFTLPGMHVNREEFPGSV